MSPIAIENGNQSTAENLVMTSAYVVRRPYRQFSRAEKRVPDIHAAFRFKAKLTILGATSGSLVFGLGLKGPPPPLNPITLLIVYPQGARVNLIETSFPNCKKAYFSLLKSARWLISTAYFMYCIRGKKS